MSNRYSIRLVVVRLAMFALFAGLAFSQGNGSIGGTVKDQNGGVVPGAAVTVANEAQALRQSATTSPEGTFVFAQLPPGVYTLTVEASGFKTTENSNVVLPVASRVNVGDVILEIGSLTETVTVEADAGTIQIQSESGERSSIVTNRQLRDIQLNGRNVVDLMRTIPGVISGGVTANAASTVTNIAGGFNINGTRGAQHEYTIDGVTNLNLGNNTGALVSVNPDALQEVKVLTSNYQAEYGRAGGGFIALTTRGGTNELHGGLRYFRRHDSLNANPYFNNLRGGAPRGFPVLSTATISTAGTSEDRFASQAWWTDGTSCFSLSVRNTTVNWYRRRRRSTFAFPPWPSAGATSPVRWTARGGRSPFWIRRPGIHSLATSSRRASSMRRARPS
jgi:hypothetical protein